MIRLALAASVASALALAAPAARAVEENPGADGYSVDTAGSTRTVGVGQKGKLALAIHPKAPWHVDPRAPLSIQLEAPAGLQLAKSRLGRKDAIEPKAEVPRFEVPFTAAAAGAQEAKAQVKFFLCRDTICAQQTRTVALTVTVK
jgi:hypothetical protein